MNNCLVTRLKESVSDNTLPRLGEFHIQVKTINADDYSARTVLKRLVLTNSKSFKVRTTGGGLFGTSADSLTKDHDTFAANTEHTIYFSNGDYDIYINEKYTLTKFVSGGYLDGNKASLFHFDLSEFSYSSTLNYLDISAGYNNFTGDIGVLPKKNVAHFTCLNSYPITGDITPFTTSWAFIPGYSAIYGDFTNIVKTGSNVGQPFKKYSNGGREVTVDMSQVNDSLSKVGFQTTGGSIHITCSWTTTRPSSYFIIPLVSSSSAKFNFGDYLDAMLINQAACTNNASKTAGTQSTIAVWGNRTSASDSAVATLKGYGYTVKVNDVTL
jgi:hypothetical protein